MPLSTGANGYPISAAMLMDPKAMKQHMANGTNPKSSHPVIAHSSHSFHRPQSEPPYLSTSPPTFDLSSYKSRDDAHLMLQGQARARLSSSQTGSHQSSPPRFDPRQLLNPKGYDPSQRRKDEEAQSSLPASPSAMHITHPDSLSTQSNGAHKRDQEEVERGMGSLIEQVHNVSKREDRSHKKQKREVPDETAEEEQRKAAFAGGGKGGEIGEYMKQKRREGQQDAGPTNAIVDLTAGTLFCWLTSRTQNAHPLSRG